MQYIFILMCDGDNILCAADENQTFSVDGCVGVSMAALALRLVIPSIR